MLGLGLASSHAPALFRPVELWPAIYDAIPEYMKASQPHTAYAETPEVLQGYIGRIDKSFKVLQDRLRAYNPDALVVIGDDQGDMFAPSMMPAICIYTGEELWGTLAVPYLPEDPKDMIITLKVHQGLARHILHKLFEYGFDPAYAEVERPVGRPEHGASHSVIHPMPRLMPGLDVPIIPIFLNEYFPPMPSAERCWQLGRVLREILDKRPERIAIYASGGLSHDPNGPRAGWVDEPLDRWFLDCLASNEHERLKSLFTFDSAALRGGTGELRAWISVAAAMDRPAHIVEYFSSHHAKIGCGFAYWGSEG